MNVTLTLAIIKIIAQYGPSAAVAIGKTIENRGKDVTEEDIEKLFITKRPEDYFKPR